MDRVWLRGRMTREIKETIIMRCSAGRGKSANNKTDRLTPMEGRGTIPTKVIWELDCEAKGVTVHRVYLWKILELFCSLQDVGPVGI